MSKTRQGSEPAVRGYVVTHPAGSVVLPVERGWDQLVCAESGSMRVSTGAGTWFIPAGRALWIPDSAPATITNRVRVAVRTLYFDTALQVLPGAPRAFMVDGLARALLLHVARECPLWLENPLHAALHTVLVDRLRALPQVPLWLPWPKDARAVEAANAMLGRKSVDEVARMVNVSRRTLERVFLQDTGLGVAAWRRRAVVLASLDLLAAGRSVTVAAAAAGYSTPSAYVVAFKAVLGDTPRQHLR